MTGQKLLSIRRHLLKNRNQGKWSLGVYLTLGYPNFDTSVELMAELSNKVDILEIGFPFSDPIADGQVIQHTSKIALQNGIKPQDLWKALDQLNGTPAKKVIMTYSNIIYKIGYSKFVQQSKKGDISGIILPDMPYDYMPSVLKKINPIYIISPNSSSKRINQIMKETTGFAYILSKLGITGGSSKSDHRLQGLYTRLHAQFPDIPLLQGFGISSTISVKAAINNGADGVIIGSHILKLLGDRGNKNLVHEFVDEISSLLEK